jgi:hypothetical protein
VKPTGGTGSATPAARSCQKYEPASCQCAASQVTPCGAPATQEDLLCDICRQVRLTPGGNCAAVTLSPGSSLHIGVVWPKAKLTFR